MSEQNNIIPFRRPEPPKPEPPTIEYGFTVHVNGADYSISKTCCAVSGKGFAKVRDAEGKLLFMYPASVVPDDAAAQMIVIWRGGFSAGFYEVFGVAGKLKEGV